MTLLLFINGMDAIRSPEVRAFYQTSRDKPMKATKRVPILLLDDAAGGFELDYTATKITRNHFSIYPNLYYNNKVCDHLQILPENLVFSFIQT